MNRINWKSRVKIVWIESEIKGLIPFEDLYIFDNWYMQAPQNLFFTPDPTIHYKIVNVA